MRLIRQVLFAALALNASGAGPVEMSGRTLVLPLAVDSLRFVDIDGDGRLDLLAVDGAAQQLLNYHQRPDGFPSAPDETILLPPHTGWAALCDVDAHPGLELLISTATGLVYSRQNGGLFESERRPLITANQIFTNSGHPLLVSLTTNKPAMADSIPVISEGQAIVYRRNNAYEWLPSPPMALTAKRYSWHVNRDGSEWVLGSAPAYSLHVQESVRANAEPEPDLQPENEAVRKIRDEMKNTHAANPPMTDRVDVNGDGREDLVLWQCIEAIGFKTDIYIFLRGADQKLPERPTQVLHCKGLPLPLGRDYKWSPVHDLNGDGACELALLELNTTVMSASGVVEALLSRGMEWSLTVRTFQHGAFSTTLAASLPLKMVLPAQVMEGWPICFQGDFNGDGRPDLLVRRSETQWSIYLSTTDGHWFASQPALTFSAPPRGYLEVVDLDGDGLSDIVWHQPEEHQFTIFMTPSRTANRKSP